MLLLPLLARFDFCWLMSEASHPIWSTSLCVADFHQSCTESVRSRVEETMGPAHRRYDKLADRLAKSTGRSTPTEPQSIPLLSLLAKVVV